MCGLLEIAQLSSEMSKLMIVKRTVSSIGLHSQQDSDSRQEIGPAPWIKMLHLPQAGINQLSRLAPSREIKAMCLLLWPTTPTALVTCCSPAQNRLSQPPTGSWCPTKLPLRWWAEECSKEAWVVGEWQGAALRLIILNRDCCSSEKSEQSLEPFSRPLPGVVTGAPEDGWCLKSHGQWCFGMTTEGCRCIPSRDLRRSNERQAGHMWLLCIAKCWLWWEFRPIRLLRSECLRPLGTGTVKFSLVDGIMQVSLRRRYSVGEQTGETCSSGKALGEGKSSFASEWSPEEQSSVWTSGTVGVGLIDLWGWMRAWSWAMRFARCVSITGALPLRAAAPKRVLRSGLIVAPHTWLVSQEWGRSGREGLLLWHW